jgi:2'-5' RNA ligase
VRLFVAVDVPAAAERVVEAAVASLRASYPQARWVPREGRHVTLRFLGWTDEGRVGGVHDAVARVASAHAPIRTRLTRPGSFPSPTRTRVLWIGLDDRSGELAGLAVALAEALADVSPTEERPFTPHLTVARADPALRLDPSVFEYRLEAPRFTIGQLVLYRSHLWPAPRYEALASFALSGPA